ncbi:MAG: rod shape-determining protein RodA [Actinomycetia bacterium]|nr:rod shape-determining protein RodA [Actinomycetes bacterium]
MDTVSPSKRGVHARIGEQRPSLLRRFLAGINWPLLIALAMITAFGLVVVYSAVFNRADYNFSRQLSGVVLGAVFMVLVWAFDYRRLLNMLLPLLIVAAVLNLLPLLPGLGVEVNGARCWINIFGQQIQPGEFAKIATILMMAAMVSRFRGKLVHGRDYLKCLALLVVPLLTIMTQPDLGTGMVLFVIGFTILFNGGADRKWLIITVLAIVALITAVLLIDPVLDGWAGHDVLLKNYQKNRLLVFMDNSIDPSGLGYNLNQAKIAIGSGGFMGKGYLQGTQSALGFLPEAATDFIFCVLAEEWGFLGALGLLGLYVFLIVVAIRIALKADVFGRLIVCGCVGMWVFQILENIGMTSGLMPITGIPLPFLSYGSSFMLVNYIAIGLIGSVWAHGRDQQSGSLGMEAINDVSKLHDRRRW